HAGNDYSLGDIALDGDRLWMLWTWERNFDGTVRDDVKGMIGFVPLTDDGIGDLTILDIEFEGKPEALAFDAGHTYILFGVDGGSKGDTPGKFDLKEHEAYVLRLEGRPSGTPMTRAR